MSGMCHSCGKTFTRKDNLKRHVDENYKGQMRGGATASFTVPMYRKLTALSLSCSLGTSIRAINLGSGFKGPVIVLISKFKGHERLYKQIRRSINLVQCLNLLNQIIFIWNFRCKILKLIFIEDLFSSNYRQIFSTKFFMAKRIIDAELAF
jgi:hypothetical protein